MAHYEANNGMTARWHWSRIASTAGGRKTGRALFLGSIPVGLNRRGHAIGHRQVLFLHPLCGWQGQDARPVVPPTTRVGEAWPGLNADLISYRRRWAGMVDCSSDQLKTAQLYRRRHESGCT